MRSTIRRKFSASQNMPFSSVDPSTLRRPEVSFEFPRQDKKGVYALSWFENVSVRRPTSLFLYNIVSHCNIPQ